MIISRSVFGLFWSFSSSSWGVWAQSGDGQAWSSNKCPSSRRWGMGRTAAGPSGAPLLEWRPRVTQTLTMLGSGHHLHLFHQAQWVGLWAPCGSHPHWGLCSETLSQPFSASPTSKSMLSSCFCFSRLCALTPGGAWLLGLPPCSRFLFPLPSFLLRPSVTICFGLLQTGAGLLGHGTPCHHLPTKDKPLQNHMQFSIWELALRNLVSVIGPEAAVCYRGSTNTEVSEIWGEKNKWVNKALATNPCSWSHNRVSGSNQNGKMKFLRINVIHRWAWCYL